MSTEIVRLCDTPQRVHAAFCERRLACLLARRVRIWKWLGKPVKR